MENYGNEYVIIGLPLSEGDDQITEFIDSTGVGTVTHVLGTDDAGLWADYGVRGTPGWLTVSANGETEAGFGAITLDVLSGDNWVS